MRKNIALILALVMILSLVPMSAFAATGSDNGMVTVPTVKNNTTFVLGTPGTDEAAAPILRIQESSAGNWRGTATGSFKFRIQLITDAEFRLAASGLTAPVDLEAAGFTQNLSAVTATPIGNKIWEIDVEWDNQANTARIDIPVLAKVMEQGEARLSVQRLNSPVSGSASITYALVADGKTITTVASATDMWRGDHEGAEIIIDETVANAVTGLQTVRFRTNSSDFRWTSGTAIQFPAGMASGVLVNGTTAGITVDGDTYTLNSDFSADREMRLEFTAAGGATDIRTIIVNPVINVRRNAPLGDVLVDMINVRGDITTARGLLIGTNKDFGVSIEVDEVIEMYAGRWDADYRVTVEIDPDVDNSLSVGRYIEFEVPAGFAIERASGDALTRINNRTWEHQVTDGSADLEFEFQITAEATVVPAGETSMELEMTVSGAGIDETSVVVADVLAPVSVEVTEAGKILQIGMQRQAGPEIVITENYPGAIMEGDLVVFVRDQFAGSMRFDNADYELVSGDIELGDIDIDGDDDEEIVIEVDEQSVDEAAVIRIYNIELTLDRTVPMGVFRLDVGGDALVDYTGAARDYEFAGRVARFDYFVVGTPVDGIDVPVQVAFTVGQMAYWVDGEMQMMDVAPFISEGRIMVPVRYMEELFGMQPIWNPTARTVTVMYNNQVFEMTIGSTMLRVNGAPFMEMDAEAIIVDSRTFVPLSRFARAMNIPYVWDAATQTVTFN